MGDVLCCLGQVPLQMTGQPRAVIEHAEQDRRPPFAARGEHLAGAVMAIPMPEAIHILGLVAASRQSGRPGRDQVRAAPGAILRDGPAIPRRPRPDQASHDDDAPDRRCAGRRGPARGARGTQLRGRIRERALALGLPPRFAQGADAARRMADADPVRRARRPLATGLPSAVVSVRNRQRTSPTACRRRCRSAVCRAPR